MAYIFIYFAGTNPSLETLLYFNQSQQKIEEKENGSQGRRSWLVAGDGEGGVGSCNLKIVRTCKAAAAAAAGYVAQ